MVGVKGQKLRKKYGECKIPKICKLCNSSYTTYNYEQKYCSRKCFHKSTIGKSTSLKGKTFEEIYGTLRAKEIRDKLKLIMPEVLKEKWKDLSSGYHSELRREKLQKCRLGQILPKKDTSIEIKLQNELRNRNINFTTHENIDNICQPDIIIRDKRIIVQADGDYWHNLNWVREKDERQDELLIKNNWIVIRFWEHEINQDTSSCVDFVQNIMNKGEV